MVQLWPFHRETRGPLDHEEIRDRAERDTQRRRIDIQRRELETQAAIVKDKAQQLRERLSHGGHGA